MKRPALVLLAGSLIGLLEGCCVGRVQPTFASSDEQIRSELFSHTPIGTHGTSVLNFVLNKMCDANISVSAYEEYVAALQAVSSRRLTARTEPEYQGRAHYGRRVYVEKYPTGLTSTLAILVWEFDSNDTLTNISVQKRIISL